MATADRDYIIERAKTRSLTAEQFDYEKLSCPYSLYQLFSYNDIWTLYDIASSPKWTGKPKEKHRIINQIMNSRGFVKLQSGTNRICYRFIEDNSFVVKVAFDGGGLKDNPAEFYNQNYLKPFCTKVFECTPNGVLASFERVNAIKSREQYYTIADDVYRLIKGVIIPCGYLMEDIGTQYFMNIGVRPGFGPVLLDFSFLYQADIKKLYCTKPDYNSISGCCDGEIDYDPGYNFLYCTKCGSKYKAIELSKRITENRTTIRQRRRNGGKVTMNFMFNGGDKNCNNEQVVVVNNNRFANSIPSMEVVKPSTIRSERPANKSGFTFSFSGGGATEEEKKNITTPEPVIEENKVEIIEPEKTVEVVEEKVEEKKVEEPESSLITVTRTGEVDKSDGESPIEMVTEESFQTDLDSLVAEFQFLKNNGSDDAKLELMVLRMLDEMIEKEPGFKNLLSSHFKSEEEFEDYYYDEDEDTENESSEEVVEAAPVQEENVAEITDDTAVEYDSDVSRFEAVTVDIHDVIDSLPSEKVLLIKNIGAEGYVTVGDNQLFVVDMIDGNYISTLGITSKDYLDNLEKEVKQYEGLEVKEAPTGA